MQQSFRTYNTEKKSQWQSWKRIAKVVGMALWIPLLIITITSAYGGYADPEVRSWLAILAMCFPGFIIATAIITILFFATKFQLGGWCGVAAILVCTPAILTYSPLNIFRSNEVDSKDEFKIMTWNILWWYPYNDKNASPSPNPDVQGVLDANPDILVLQESTLINTGTYGITDEQYKEFNQRYKYSYSNYNNDYLTLYSRYPFTCSPETSTPGKQGYIKYTLDIKGQTLTLFNVHLQNIHLSAEDTNLYVELLNGIPEASEVREAKIALLDKLAVAYKLRAQQAKSLRKNIDEVQGNVIVCGDFNDIPGSFSVRTIRGNDLNDAYADAGFGPGISFRSHKMFFRIDHILYRGDFKAVNAKRLKVGQSDHYPILATFKWEKIKNSKPTK